MCLLSPARLCNGCCFSSAGCVAAVVEELLGAQRMLVHGWQQRHMEVVWPAPGCTAELAVGACAVVVGRASCATPMESAVLCCQGLPCFGG
jgi:hypothetical protein